jgi:hypothetical protein
MTFKDIVVVITTILTCCFGAITTLAFVLMLAGNPTAINGVLGAGFWTVAFGTATVIFIFMED